MSDDQDVQPFEDDDEAAEERTPRRARRSAACPGCLAVLVALAVLVGGFYFGVTKGVDWVSDQFSAPRTTPARAAAR